MTRTGKPSCILKGHIDGANAVAWCLAGTRLASASRDRTVKIWDATSGKEGVTFKGHTDFVMSVAWSPDGKRLASTGIEAGGTFKIWDAAAGKEAITFKGAGGLSVAWSPDGLRLAATGYSAPPMIFGAADGYRLAERSGRGDKSRPSKTTRFKKP